MLEWADSTPNSKPRFSGIVLHDRNFYGSKDSSSILIHIQIQNISYWYSLSLGEASRICVEDLMSESDKSQMDPELLKCLSKVMSVFNPPIFENSWTFRQNILIELLKGRS